MIKIYSDGATIGYNGKLGTVKTVTIAVSIPELNYAGYMKVPGISNNEAEFKAIIWAMETAIEKGIKEAIFYSDSTIIINRANGSRPKKKKYANERMDKFQDKLFELAKNFDYIEFEYIPREQNTVADYYSNLAKFEPISGTNSYFNSEKLKPSENKNINMKLSDIIFLDTETTQKKGGRLVQLALMDYEAPSPLVTTYKPAEPISIEAMVIHGITNEEVSALMPFVGFDEKINQKIKESILVAHNAPFDIDVMNREGVHTGKFIDTLKIAHLLIDSPSHSLQYLRYFLKLNVPKEAAAHDAGGDVLVLAELFKYLYPLMVEKIKKDYEATPMESMVLDRMVEVSGKPMLMRTMLFGKYQGETFEEIKKKDKEYLEWLIMRPDLTEDLMYTLETHLGYLETNN